MIFSLESIIILLLTYLLLFIIGLPLYIQFVVNCKLKPSIEGLMVYPLAIGIALLVFFGYLLTTIGLFSYTLFYALGTSVVGLSLVKNKFKSFIKEGLVNSRKNLKYNVLLITLFIMSLFSRFLPYYDKLVYSGYDIKLYSYIAKLISIQQSFPPVLPDRLQELSTVYDSHFLFSGSEIVIALLFKIFNNFNFNIPIIYSLFLLLLNSLYGFSLLTLLNIIFPVNRFTNLFGAAIAIFVFNYPYYFVHWGGVGETFVWFIYPVILGINLSGPDGRGIRFLLNLFLFLATVLIHPLSAFLLFILLTIAIVERGGVKQLIRDAAGLITAWLFLLPHLVYSVLTLLRLHEEQPPGVFGWAGTEFPWISFVMSMSLIAVILFDKKQRNKIAFVAVWLVLIFSLAGYNSMRINPLDIPLIFYFLPSRLEILALWGLIIIVAAIIQRAFEITKRNTSKIVLASVILALIIGVGGWNLYATYETVDWGNSLVISDLAAFDWIEKNTKEGDLFLVTVADASPWLIVYTNRDAICIPHITNSLKVQKDCREIENMLSFPHKYNISQIKNRFRNFLHEYNISYIFISHRNEYDRPRYKLDALFKTELVTIVFKEADTLVLKVVNN